MAATTNVSCSPRFRRRHVIFRDRRGAAGPGTFPVHGAGTGPGTCQRSRHVARADVAARPSPDGEKRGPRASLPDALCLPFPFTLPSPPVALLTPPGTVILAGQSFIAAAGWPEHRALRQNRVEIVLATGELTPTFRRCPPPGARRPQTAGPAPRDGLVVIARQEPAPAPRAVRTRRLLVSETSTASLGQPAGSRQPRPGGKGRDIDRPRCWSRSANSSPVRSPGNVDAGDRDFKRGRDQSSALGDAQYRSPRFMTPGNGRRASTSCRGSSAPTRASPKLFALASRKRLHDYGRRASCPSPSARLHPEGKRLGDNHDEIG